MTGERNEDFILQCTEPELEYLIFICVGVTVGVRSMLALLRARTLASSSSSSSSRSPWYSQGLQQWKLGFSSSSAIDGSGKGLLNLKEIEKVLNDVKADDVKVIPVPKHCDWADFMVLASGRSTWHVKNIAQALIYEAGTFALVLTLFSVFVLTLTEFGRESV